MPNSAPRTKSENANFQITLRYANQSKKKKKNVINKNTRFLVSTSCSNRVQYRPKLMNNALGPVCQESVSQSIALTGSY